MSGERSLTRIDVSEGELPERTVCSHEGHEWSVSPLSMSGYERRCRRCGREEAYGYE